MTLTQIHITCSCMTYLQTVFCSIFPRSQAITSAQIVVLKAGTMTMHFLVLMRIEDNAKFGIYFVLRISIVFSPQDDIFIYYIAEIFKKL